MIFFFFVSIYQVTQESCDPTEKVHLPVTMEEEALKNQTKAVLLTELISMELFYGLEDLLRLDPTTITQRVTSSKLYSLTDKDLLLHSAETLLEVDVKILQFLNQNRCCCFLLGHHSMSCHN